MPRFNFTNITLQDKADITDIMNNFNKIEQLAATSEEVTAATAAVEAKIPTSIATPAANGLMSKEDKTKLNGVEPGANNYTLPTGAKDVLGGVKTSSTVTSNSGYTACPIISGIPYYKDTNTTYSNATTSAAGLMSNTDKSKLDGIASGANKTTVENVLTSTSTTNALSAAQGKALNDALTGKQKTISYGTAAPSGGSNGDIYIQYYT